MPDPSNNIRLITITRPGGEDEICEPFATVYDYIEVRSDADDSEVDELVGLYLANRKQNEPKFF